MKPTDATVKANRNTTGEIADCISSRKTKNQRFCDRDFHYDDYLRQPGELAEKKSEIKLGLNLLWGSFQSGILPGRVCCHESFAFAAFGCDCDIFVRDSQLLCHGRKSISNNELTKWIFRVGTCTCWLVEYRVWFVVSLLRFPRTCTLLIINICSTVLFKSHIFFNKHNVFL